MRLDELERWLYEHGFTLDHIRGSHRTYRHEATRYRVTVPVHGRVIPDYTVRHTLKKIEQMKGETGR